MTSKPRTIGILGGGTAGYLTALALHRHVPHARVEVIAARDIPPIGVGESTFPHIVDFVHEYLRLDAAPFYRDVEPTWKLGSRFEWGLPGEHWFNFPFDVSDHKAVHVDGYELRRGSLMAVLMDDEKTFLLSAGAHGRYSMVGKGAFAYQLDNRKFISYLRDQVARAGIELLDAQIDRIDVDEQCNNVTGLHASDGRSFRYDMYIDCSGFRSVLLGGALRVPYVDFSSSLFTDSAVIGMLPNHGRVRPYTTCRTMDNGWMWLISMRNEDHLGYVYASSHTSDEAAVAEFERKTGVQAHPHVLRFPRGRHEQQWKGNVIAIGNSFAFVEPLQATGIQMILGAIRRAVDAINSPDDTETSSQRYNQASNQKWDFLRGFIAMHYRFNKRIDSAFWQDCQREVELAGMAPLVQYFHERGLLSVADPETRAGFAVLWESGIFGTNGVDLVLLGQGEQPGGSVPAPSAERRAWLARKQAVWQQISRQALTQQAALALFERQLLPIH